MASMGRYELIQQLGAGSMGTVYLARDTSLLREIALKTIKTGLDVDEEIRTRFLQEARVCASLQHPNIVTVYEFGEHESFAYIAMELLHGSDLRKMIEQPSALPLKTKLEAMIQVCEALGFAHRQGVVHRDVKPSNLMLCTDNRAKVLDFGIAHLPSSRLTVVGRVMGTPNYMAPEQVLGKKSDGRADLFSAAIVFFEFLVGKHPFEASLIPRRILDGEPDSIFDHDSSIPVPFEKIFARALDKDPANRYATGEEFASDIRAVLDAVRMNSSPKFSKLFLPSTRSVPGATPAAKIVNEAPGTDDPESKRMSQYIRVLSSFDDALARGLWEPAKDAFQQMKEIAAADPRFRDSIQSSEARLKAAGSPGKEPAQVSDSGDYTRVMGVAPAEPIDTGAALCPSCGTGNRVSAAFCVGCGSALSPAQAAPPKEPLPPQAPPQVPLKAQTAPVKPAVPSTTSGKAASPNRKQTVLIACAAVGASLMVVVAGLLVVNGGPKEEPYIGTAQIAASSTPLLAAPGGAAKLSLDRNTPVHVLKAAQTDWIDVQPVVSGKLKESGFIRAEAASGLSFKDPASGLAFVGAIGPGASGNAGQIALQIALYQQVVTQFPGKPEARTAALEAARLALDTAKRKKTAGLPESEWDTWISKSKELLSAFPSDPQISALQTEGDGLKESSAPRVETAANPQTTANLPLSAPIPPNPNPPVDSGGPSGQPSQEPPPTPVSASMVATMLAQAQEMRLKGDYPGALRIITRVLKTNPDDTGAKQLRRDVVNEKKLVQP